MNLPISTFSYTSSDVPDITIDTKSIVYPKPIRTTIYSQETPSSPLVISEGFSAPVITVQPYSTQYTAEEMQYFNQLMGPVITYPSLPEEATEPVEFLEFKVEATGTNVKYQWKQNGNILPNGTSSTLRITELYNYSSDSSLNSITVDVYNRHGKVTSEPIVFDAVNSSDFQSYLPLVDDSKIIPQTLFTKVNTGDVITVGNYPGAFSFPYAPNAQFVKNIRFYDNNTVYENHTNVTSSTKSFVVPSILPYVSGGTLFVKTRVSANINVSSPIDLDPNHSVNITRNFIVNRNPVSERFKAVKEESLNLLDSIFAVAPITSNLTTSNKLWIYNSISRTSASFNTSLWCYSRRDVLNFSGVAFIPPVDPGDFDTNVTLITPQHFVSASHYPPLYAPAQRSGRVWFYRHNDGVAIEAQVEQLRPLAGTDFTIGKLVSPITDPNIKIYPIVSDYFSELYQDAHLPFFAISGKAITDNPSKDYGLGLFTNYFNEQLTEIRSVRGYGLEGIEITGQPLRNIKDSYPNYTVGTLPASGDSSNPVFAFTPEGLSLITTWHRPTTGPAIFASNISSHIDTCLASSSFNPGGYTVTRTSLGLPFFT
jgi:hypothetical protein